MFPVRVLIGAQFLMACLVSYMLRVNLSVNIVAMVLQKPKPPTTTECFSSNGGEALNPNYGERYDWGNQIQGIILGAYFWGYIPGCAIAGYLAERFSARDVVGYSVALSAVLTFLTPISAHWGYISLMIVRLLLGFLGALVYPCLHSMIAKWAPPEEKGKFVAALMGNALGTVITWAFIGYVIEEMGWSWGFHIPGIFSLVWSLSWFALVSDTPEKHRFISAEEIKYISESIGDKISKVKRPAPLKKMLTSGPYLSLTLLHFGNLWGLIFLLTLAPKFLTEILGFNLHSSGILSGLPYLARIFSAFIFGSIVDYLRRTNRFSVTAIRKFFCIFSHILPGILLLLILVIGCDVTIAVLLLTLSLGFNGASSVTNLANSQDLAPNFAGSLYGWMNAAGSVSGILAPAMSGFITRNDNSMTQWHYSFTVGAVIYFASTALFFWKGSGQEQPWNKLPTPTESKRESETIPEKQGQENPAFTQC